MALTESTSIENITPIVGQPISQTQIDVLKLATNAANAIYNLDDPSSNVHVGYILDAQPDLRFVGGMPQPYSSDPGYILEHQQVDPSNGFKAGIFVNQDANTIIIANAGMDGFSNPQDQSSGVVWNGSNQFNSYAGTDVNTANENLRQDLINMINGGQINSNTKIIFNVTCSPI